MVEPDRDRPPPEERMNESTPPEDKRQPEEEVLPGGDTRFKEPGDSPAPEPDTSESLPDPETEGPVVSSRGSR